VTLLWTKPKDSGCLPITSYIIQAKLSGVWTTVGTSVQETGVADLTDNKGVLTNLRIIAVNAIGSGEPSAIVNYTSAALPSAVLLIEVVEYGPTSLWLRWTVPLDTGIGDRTLPIISYELQVDEGFGSGFITLTESNYTALATECVLQT
jgi:hypothetical protein